MSVVATADEAITGPVELTCVDAHNIRSVGVSSAINISSTFGSAERRCSHSRLLLFSKAYTLPAVIFRIFGILSASCSIAVSAAVSRDSKDSSRIGEMT